MMVFKVRLKGIFLKVAQNIGKPFSQFWMTFFEFLS